MGSSLTGTKIKDTYDSLIKVSDNGALDGTLQTLTDGLGNNSALSLSTAGASVTGTLAVSGAATFSGALNGTLSTAAQTNITSVGTLSSLAVSGNLTVDTNTLYVDASNNRVGIGTTPSAKLHLGGTAPLDSIIRQDSTASGTNWEIGEREAGKWQIWQDDTDSVVATFLSSGNVGIGTSISDYKLVVRSSDPVVAAFNTYEIGDASTSIDIGGFSNGLGSVRIKANHYHAATSASSISFLVNNSSFETARMLSSGGITFNGDTSSANALDDYEEGTFTATLKGSVSDPSSPVTTSGRYTKIGDVVTVRVQFASVDTTGASGLVNVQGLPFTVSGPTVAPVLLNLFDFGTGTSPVAYVNSATNIGILATQDNGSFVDVTHSAGASRWLVFTMTYFV